MMNEEIKATAIKQRNERLEIIGKIPINKANLEHIAKYGRINGSLLIDIEKCMYKYISSLFRWRKVEEELPPFYQDVIFKVNIFAKTYHSEMASIGHIINNGGYKLQIDLLARDILEYQIVEWMPIPQ